MVGYVEEGAVVDLTPRLRDVDRPVLGWVYQLFPSLLGSRAVVKPQTR